jgi:aminoglycoside phosphotransferase family enzyme
LMCYKACVRAKVSLFRAKSLDKTNNNSNHNRKRVIEQAEEEARRHLQLAESHLPLL